MRENVCARTRRTDPWLCNEPAARALVLTLAVFGSDEFITYLADNPVAKMPAQRWSETSNQSLLATILRLSESSFSGGSPLTHPIYLVSAVVLSSITCWLVLSSNESNSDWALGLVLMLALLVYPASQFFYSVLLVVPIVLLWVNRERLPTGTWGVGVLITLTCVLIVYAGFVFIANLILWIALAASLAHENLIRHIEVQDPIQMANEPRIQS